MLNYNYHYKIQPQQIKTVLELLKAGETLQAVGDRYGTSRERVRQIAAKNGLKRQNFGRAVQKERTFSQETGTNGVWRLDSLERVQYDLFKKHFPRGSNIHFTDIEWNLTCPVFGTKIDYYSEGKEPNSPVIEDRKVISKKASQFTKMVHTKQFHPDDFFAIYLYLKNK